MPVRLRLRRLGRKGRPYYHIVAADSRSPRDGKYIEQVGSYDPTTQPASIQVDTDKALKWLKNGAQPSHTVKAIFRYTGVNLRFALHKQGKTEEEAQSIYDRWSKEKESAIESHKDSLRAKKEAEAKEAFEREAKIREEKEAAIAARNKPEEEAPAEEEAAPEAEASTEAEVEASAEETAETPAEEAAEAPAEETKENTEE